MAPRLKQNYPELIVEYDRRVRDGETPQAIKADFHSRGIHWGHVPKPADENQAEGTGDHDV